MDYYAEPDPDGPDPEPPSPRRGGSSVMIAAVVVLVLAAGGGAFAVVSSLTGNNTGGHPSSQPTSAAPTQPASSGLATTPPARSTATASPSASPKKSAKASTVAVSSSAAANPAAARVRTLLEHYFAAINAHDYAAYNSLLDAQMQQQNPQSKFASGYATTRDSAETLTSIANIGGGSLAATVTFTSHQSPADSINNSSCTAWTITLYLQPQNGGYVIGVPPAGYRSVHQDCP
jgi:hypothetical protein